MTLQELIRQGPARNKALMPEGCVFTRRDGVMLKKWAADNNILWSCNVAVTPASLDKVFGGHVFGALALEKNGGRHELYFCGSESWDEALNEVRKCMTRPDILLDRAAVQPQRELPAMEF
jgi:hypothetical protein